MIRTSTNDDLLKVVTIYDKILDREPVRAMTGWRKGRYPTQETALEAHNNGELYVMEAGSAVVAAAILNQKQLPEYAHCDWAFPAGEKDILVIHTLVVDPDQSGKGYASDFIHFYEREAAQRGCRCLRLDTNERNTAARGLYRKLGYREAGIVNCRFNGMEGIRLVCLEKKLDA